MITRMNLQIAVHQPVCSNMHQFQRSSLSFSVIRFVEGNYHCRLSCIAHYYLSILVTSFDCILKVQLKYDVVVEGRPDAKGKSSMISQHLKIVEVKCFEVDQRLLNLLKFLGSLNICKIMTKTASVLHFQLGFIYLHVVAIQYYLQRCLINFYNLYLCM